MAEPPKFARVTEIQEIAASVRRIDLEMIEPARLEYKSGQTILLYAGFVDGKEIKRQYTLASAPFEDDGRKLLLCVKLIPGGPASGYLERLKVGDQVTLSGPVGKCTLSPDLTGDILFCITGNGFAPVRGMLLSYFQKVVPSSFFDRVLGKAPKVRLLWSLKTEQDIFWQAEVLAPLLSKHKNFQYDLTLTQADASWKGTRGRLTAAAVQTAKALKTPTIFLIGNGSMIKDVRKRLEEEAKIPRDSILTEAFFTPKNRGEGLTGTPPAGDS
jgi:ferredoxin-NADP reductase